MISHNGRYPSYLFEGNIFMSGKQNVAATQRSDLPKCPMITLNTTFLTDLEIFDAATNQTLSNESAGFEFIHGRLRGMFMIISYSVKNIRVKATTDTTENVVASFNSLKTLLHCYQTKFLLSFNAQAVFFNLERTF